MVPNVIWRDAEDGGTFEGFDPNLIYVETRSDNWPNDGSVSIDDGTLHLVAWEGSRPFVHLLTTPMSYRASMTLRVISSPERGIPLRIGMWSVRERIGYYLDFGAAPNRSIVGQLIRMGTLIRRDDLGSYSLGRRYRLDVDLDKERRTLDVRLADAEDLPPDEQPVLANIVLDSDQGQGLLESFRPSLSIWASAEKGTSVAVVEDYRLTLPSRLWMVSRKDDPLATLGLTLFGILVGFGSLATWRLRSRPHAGLSRAMTSISEFASRIRSDPRPALIVAVALIGFLALNVLSFSLGSHPFDMSSRQIWSYIGVNYGSLESSSLANTVTLAKVWNGAPYHNAVFPYPAPMAYYHTLLGWLSTMLIGGPAGLVDDTFSAEVVFKASNLAFSVADAILIYLILVKTTRSRTLAVTGSGMFLFNPAIWADMSLWGQTESVSLFFVFLSIWLAIHEHPTGAWLAIGAAALTRPQMMFLALLLGLVYVKHFRIRETLEGVSWTLLAQFVIFAPVSICFGPGWLPEYIQRVGQIQIGASGESALMGVSRGGANLWMLITHIVDGAVGLQRKQLSKSHSLVGDLSYQDVSNLILAVVVLGTVALIFARRREDNSVATYLPVVAFGLICWNMVATGRAARYFLYSLAILIASDAAIPTRRYLLSVGLLTATTAPTIVAVLASGIRPDFQSKLNPATNRFMGFMSDLEVTDWFITDAVIINLLALLLVGTVVVRGVRPRP